MVQLSTSTKTACCGVRLHLDMPSVFCLVSTGDIHEHLDMPSVLCWWVPGIYMYIWICPQSYVGEYLDIHLNMPSVFCSASIGIYIRYAHSPLFDKYRDIHLDMPSVWICPQSYGHWVQVYSVTEIISLSSGSITHNIVGFTEWV